MELQVPALCTLEMTTLALTEQKLGTFLEKKVLQKWIQLKKVRAFAEGFN